MLLSIPSLIKEVEWFVQWAMSVVECSYSAQLLNPETKPNVTTIPPYRTKTCNNSYSRIYLWKKYKVLISLKD